MGYNGKFWYLTFLKICGYFFLISCIISIKDVIQFDNEETAEKVRNHFYICYNKKAKRCIYSPGKKGTSVGLFFLVLYTLH